MNRKQVIVFVCEHGAAKSIVAAAYFNRFAKDEGLDWQAIARGTNPEEELSPQAVEGLLRDGLTPTESKPQRLASTDIQSAQRVVTFCKLPVEYQQQTLIERWDDIPPISESYETARAALVKHIRYFVNQIK